MSKCTAYWGQHCSASQFKSLNKWQKVNHFPGSWALGNKARLGKTMGAMRRRYVVVVVVVVLSMIVFGTALFM